MLSLPHRRHSKPTRLLVLLAVLLILPACRRERQVINETWSIVELLSREEKQETVLENITVRNCGIEETKSVFCSAGTVNELGLEFGGDAGFSGLLDGSVNASIGAVLGIGRESGESINLPAPDNGYIYDYAVTKTYKVFMGEFLARSASGLEEPVNFSFNASCSISLEPPTVRTCAAATEAATTAPTHTPKAPAPTATNRPQSPTNTPRPTALTPTGQPVENPPTRMARNFQLQLFTDPQGVFSFERPSIFSEGMPISDRIDIFGEETDIYGYVVYHENLVDSVGIIFFILADSALTDAEWQNWVSTNLQGSTTPGTDDPHSIYEEDVDRLSLYKEKSGVVLVAGINGELLTQDKELSREILDSITWNPDEARQAIQNN